MNLNYSENMNRQPFYNMLQAIQILSKQDLNGMSREEAMPYLLAIDTCIASLLDLNRRDMLLNPEEETANAQVEVEVEATAQDEPDPLHFDELSSISPSSDSAILYLSSSEEEEDEHDIYAENYTLPEEQFWGEEDSDLYPHITVRRKRDKKKDDILQCNDPHPMLGSNIAETWLQEAKVSFDNIKERSAAWRAEYDSDSWLAEWSSRKGPLSIQELS